MNQEIHWGKIAALVVAIAGIATVFFVMGEKSSERSATRAVPTRAQNVSKGMSDTDTSVPIMMQDNDIEWYGQAKPIQAPRLFKKGKAGDVSVKAWEVGALKGGSSGEKVIFITIDHNDPAGVVEYVFVTNTYTGGKELLPYREYSSRIFSADFDADDINDDVVGSYYGDKIVSLEYPGFLYFNNLTFQSETYANDDSDAENPFFHPEESDIYEKIYTDRIYGDVFLNTEDGGVYLKSPIGTAKAYSLKIDFLSGGIPQVVWNDGAKTQNKFISQGVGGCGTSKYTDDVSGEIPMDALVPAGATNNGGIVYEYKDKNVEYLKKWYQDNVEMSKDWEEENWGKTVSYEQFVGNHPVFFWKDSMGRLVRFINQNDFLGGCGKPVIYLYPEQTTVVSVKVTPTGGMTVSDPAYGNGWNVSADPHSNITNLADGRVYPYLFWEGSGDSIYRMPEKGFVTSKENLENLLDEKLSRLGLIRKEINDFKDFWLPKMLSEDKPYYFMTFVSRREIDNLAPLDISPKPDSIIRVLMDYKGLDEYASVAGFEIKTPERKGFTVVEWGGVLR